MDAHYEIFMLNGDLRGISRRWGRMENRLWWLIATHNHY